MRLRHLAVLATCLLGASPAWAGPPPAAPVAAAPARAAAPRRHERVERGEFANPLDADFAVHWMRPADVDAGVRLPVVVFLHGFGAPGPLPYEAWLEHLAAQGQIVVYPVYPAIEARSARTRYDAMWAGVSAAMRGALPSPGAQPDPTRLGVVGHSFGAGAAPAIAARAAARGWGSAALWILCLAPWYDLDAGAWTALPSHAHLVSVAYEEDRVCDPAIAATFPDRATTIPAERKAFRCLCTDTHGSPALKADHHTPLTLRGVDVFDVRGTWDLADALRAGAEGDARALARAMGRGTDALDLGAWSDGVPVRPPVLAWPPPDPPDPAPRSRQWRPGGKQEEVMRRLLRPEAFTTLPLPAPAEAPASRLPPSERFLAPPPTAPWPPAAAEALAGGPVLLVPVAGVPAPALARLSATGVRVVPLPPDDASAAGRALAEAPAPSAILVGREGAALLWRRADDPGLADAVADLVRPAR